MLVTGNNLKMIQDTKESLHKAFKIKDLGELKFFLGMEFSRPNKFILVNQRKYALEIISDLGLGDAKSSWTPLEVNVKLTVQEYDKLIEKKDDHVLVGRNQYQRLIGNCYWASYLNTRISVSGFLIKYVDSLVSWKSKKQSIISKCSAEAEYISMSSAVSEVVWLTALLKELEVDVALPFDLFSDNKTALQIVSNTIYHERTKHIEIDCHFIREKI
uniref:Uncharacterized mitochondrial protein AtMg00810-like n=1 Tax=Nicotiana tabacum TaxID=4097 RepID=A0A1S3YE72_TOBAC|nr:PREDICTED: uncharacterized mitochondrial protein AtMg00810-like [Nicotiana tabacum]